jgi:alpha-galactosidase
MDLLELYGTFPGAGDRHVAEFFPAYLRRPDEAFERYGVRLTTIADRERARARSIDAVVRQLDGRAAITLKPSGEQAVPVIESLSGLGSGEFVVNTPNQGQLPCVPEGAVVECLATIDGAGIHPRVIPTLGTGVQAWVQMHVAAQELVVAAALEERDDLALQALLIDPLSHQLSSVQARSLLRDLVAHNARFAGPPA